MNHEKIQKHCFIGGCVFLIGALTLEFKNAYGSEMIENPTMFELRPIVRHEP